MKPSYRRPLDIAAELGVDSLFAWPYRGGEGSIQESLDPGRVWVTIGETYRRLSI